ncbi:MAG TPA: CusA/CzcA family heavy metal efflux RND transporter [Bacteroidales bacterium]|nr:CusA/CzcA family heavy metal efflux RND transporter [Bacteroidales bacterium]HSA42572.1 CusA/CzcA family heavy metal efflux RND transporter [Bacteroidales bacterium]
MLEQMIGFSIRNKLIVILFTVTVAGFGLFAVWKIPVGAVPDITNNQVQVITTSANLSTQEIEQFITAPVEMEMANLPGVSEIRSVSKFGISLVTVVFEEKMGTYLPRQLIAEKIRSAGQKIPEAYGEPEMGPVSTGLGEIYQYTLEIEDAYKDRYTATDLRTIQDWIVKRRLSGIKGVVEINSWGGYLKQYEVALDPHRLSNLNISILDVFNAIERNNSIQGGAYIEKANQSYFIRGTGGIASIEDIADIVVKNKGGLPILVRDVAEVRQGHANRFGAITANGKGETVLGQVMMLKNANSKEVIRLVKERIADIQQNLPPGIHISPIVDRSDLVSKTTFTVAENLILGALIVMLTVILLLGNLRLALVIASIIPLALLFTIALMYLLNIDANLMSLGALDFGVIIDGAVIIVEFIALSLVAGHSDLVKMKRSERRDYLDRIAFTGSSRMMKSAIFGQIIILIVFIPILSLSGVEGKMFHPMALSFCFAIIGAMIFGLTWLPVASSIFIRPIHPSGNRITRWIMQQVYRSYDPVICWACNHKGIVLTAAAISLVFTFVLFSSMGGEFVPTLDEGDFVIQPVLKTGTSLAKTIETTTRMEQILIEKFPEVDRIVSRIGAAEVPTDPMSMEEVDMIIRLKPKSGWTSAKTKEALAEKFKEALAVLPGIEYEFTQPIEMRFNELITGVRADIAIKVFGDDLQYIDRKANEIKELIQNIEGAEDILVEKTAGLPQVRVQYDREKIARYGTDIQTLNQCLSTAMGGAAAGVVFEGERRYDLVVRYDRRNRSDIENVRKLLVPLPDGTLIPLSEFGEISYTEGPAKISRENTHRRVVVSVNVRNRDLQSVVEDIRNTVDTRVNMAPGTFISYGGQFENLQNASRRLMLAVPVALLLIFIFLHFAFRSFRDAFLIFSAIPLATVGGVCLLWLRGMPFSVSAGVGFIALFGIAVLNGIVLIEHLKELQHQGLSDMRKLITTGARDRLRPVLLTAGAAAMGFLPMALSTGAGAEVQRPLATVVIGGLFTSTLLTMVALPLLYEIFHNVKGIRFFPPRLIRKNIALLLLLPCLGCLPVLAQQEPLSLENAIDLALKNNKGAEGFSLKVRESEMLEKTAFSPEKTVVYYGYDENNIADNGYPLKVIGVQQQFSFPTQYVSASRLRKINRIAMETERQIYLDALRKSVSSAYFEVQHNQGILNVYSDMDSLYAKLAAAAKLKYALGEISQLENLTLMARSQQINLQYQAAQTELQNANEKLRTIIGIDSNIRVSDTLRILGPSVTDLSATPFFLLTSINQTKHQVLEKLERQRLLPDLSLSYFVGSNKKPESRYYTGFEFGLAIPVFFGSQAAGIRAAKAASRAEACFSEQKRQAMMSKQKALQREQANHLKYLNFYKNTGEKLAEEMKRTALASYNKGETDFFRLVGSYDNAMQIVTEYFEQVFRYNLCTLELMYPSE